MLAYTIVFVILNADIINQHTHTVILFLAKGRAKSSFKCGTIVKT